LANSRYVGATNGLTITDGGAQGLFNISTTGALLSLVNSGTGFQVKTSATAITPRSITVSGAGLSISNGSGVSGDPTISLSGQVANLANVSANGLLTITTAGGISATLIQGTTSQTAVTNGTGIGGYPTIGLADNAVMPGTGSITIPSGTTSQQPVSSVGGMMRYDTTQGAFYGYSSGSWRQFSLTGGVTQVDTGTGLTGGPITSTGTISIANTTVTAGSYGSSTQVGTFTVNAQGQLTAASNATITPSGIGAVSSVSGTANEITATGTTNVTLSLPSALTFTSKTVTGGAFNMTSATVGSDTVTTNTASQTLTNKTISGASNTLSNIANASLTNSSVTYNGVSVALGASGTITAANPNALTIGTGLSGTSYTGAAAVTIAIDSTVATLTGTQTLTNKTISGSSNTLSNIANASLTNSSVTVGTTAISLGSSSLTLGGLTSVAVTQDPTSALQLATKQYVDAVAQNLNIHASCNAATTGTLASITGGTVTYNNGTSGVGATLTLSVALTTLDGYTILNGNRLLIKNEVTSANNGIYTWATGGTVLTRATDFDTNVEIASGDFTFVTSGTTYSNTGWVQTLPVTTVGTSPISFTQFSGAGTYTAGTGLTLTGTVFSITNTAVTAAAYGSATQVGTFTVNAQGQLTLAGNTTVTPAVGSITGLGTSVATALGVAVGTAGSFVVNGGVLGTPSSGTLTNATGLPISTGVSGLGTNVATALGVAIGSAGAPVTFNGALGTPSSGTVTNLTGTASININGTVGATTANTGAFTTLSASSTVSGTGFSTYFASPPAIGGTAAAAITGTTITATTFSGPHNGTVGATTPSTGAFTTVSATGVITSTVATGTAPFTVASTTQVANLNAATAGTAGNVTGTVAVANGGTGLTSTPANGALDIGNGTGFTRTTLTAGSGISITNASGAITIASSGGSGTVTSVAATVPAFLSVTGSPITTSGTLAISLSGTALPVANGGTGVTSSTGSGSVVLGTSPTLATPTINSAQVSTISGSAPLFLGRAWVMFNGSNGSIYGQGNVSSVSRNGTGNYRVNFSSGMPDANYSAVASCAGQGSVNGSTNCMLVNATSGGSNSAPSTSYTDLYCYHSGNQVAQDTAYITFSLFR
jgi:hypothetical protein